MNKIDLPNGYWEFKSKLDKHFIRMFVSAILMIVIGFVSAIIDINVAKIPKVGAYIISFIEIGLLIVTIYSSIRYRFAKCIKCGNGLFLFNPFSQKCKSCGLPLNLRKGEL